ncbi:MAG: hypothetical protein N3A54_07535, partial [Patescibacteria group bacterium]|nr:hypothetical protein [Patescibacteria group bacterium]
MRPCSIFGFMLVVPWGVCPTSPRATHGAWPPDHPKDILLRQNTYSVRALYHMPTRCRQDVPIGLQNV